MRLILVVAGVLAISGCTSMEANRATIRDRYMGKPLSVSIAAMGYPSSTMNMDGRTIHTWVKEDSWGNPCELRLEVSPAGLVVGESMNARLPEACEKFTD